MRQGVIRTVLIVLFWAELVLVLYGVTIGIELQREILSITNINSGWLHVVAFLVMALTAFLIWDRTFLIVAALVLLAVLIEAAQLVIHGRTASVLDGVASSAGIVFGSVYWLLYRRLWPSAGDPNVYGDGGGQTPAITSPRDTE
ncbi:VanZ family protein [Mesorhizobium australicum]|uniref:VanZ like family protein n=1 Tax=Mesorhizobium australicum TaxID=536018 RepID=A0A1X7NRA5_9HYPH|nr:VanZ family protein [Mesorhizobium australicum]SMH40592.1 hypothetical protein SAMN02982922_2376 [Mesorhizobium australicum]